jgi:hypothetical protein
MSSTHSVAIERNLGQRTPPTPLQNEPNSFKAEAPRATPADGELGGRSDTVRKIHAALDASGVEFIDENGGGPGVRLRKRIHKKPGK